MGSFKIENLTFTYPNRQNSALDEMEWYAKTDTNKADEFMVINSGTITKYAQLRNDTGTYNSWHCVSVNVSTTKTDTLRYVLWTNSCKDKRLVFKLV